MENKITRDIISKLRTDKIKSKKLRRYTLINGYLLGKKAKGSNELKIMLPLYSGLIMMCIAHLQCHSGLKGTLSIFNRFYDMENKTHAAELVISTCRGCILTKTPNDPKNEFRDGKLKHGTYPREIIAVDFFKIKAGTTVYKQKIEWVMCIVDSFSKFICLYGQPNLNTNYTLRNLEHFFCTYGAAKEIRTDMGSNLCINKKVQELCKNYGTKCMLGLPYHSQGRGQVERANKTARETILALAGSLNKSQADVINLAQFISNSVIRTYHIDTGNGPIQN